RFVQEAAAAHAEARKEHFRTQVVLVEQEALSAEHLIKQPEQPERVGWGAGVEDVEARLARDAEREPRRAQPAVEELAHVIEARARQGRRRIAIDVHALE